MLDGPTRRAPRGTILRLLRVVLVAMMVLNLAGVAHAFEECVEDMVHVSAQGHSAHVAEHPEGQPDTDSEHDCYGGMHNCNCCPTVHVSLTSSFDLECGAVVLGDALPEYDDVRASGVRRRLERPPTT
ncbi:MAG: hypothetical protein K0V04_20820 [Deltaproteobacteria bacterium]|nr:hypothetical protein [Deltaproteobacteria bacterium]